MTAEIFGLTHECQDPDCHIPGFVDTLRRMSAEQTPDIAAVLAEHRLRWPTRCTCGWKTTITGDARNAEGVDVLVQYDAHLAAALAPVLAAAVREAVVGELRDVANEGAGVAYLGAGMPFDAVSLAFIEQRAEEWGRADRITEPVSHEAATSGEEAPSCNCPRFSDTGGFRIADLTCPVHGVNGTEPGDGYWAGVSDE